MYKSGIAGFQGRLTRVFLEKLPQTYVLHKFAPSSNGWMYLLLNILAGMSTICLIDLGHSGIRWNIKVVLICISLTAKDVEHFFKSFLVIWVSSFDLVLWKLVLFFHIDSGGGTQVDGLNGRALYQICHLTGPTVLETAKILFPCEHWKKFMFLYGKSIFTHEKNVLFF